MRPDEAALARRVVVFGHIGVAVVVTVMGSPPQRATLDRAVADAGEHELEEATGAVGAVRQVAVVKTGDGEHAHGVERHRHPHGGPAPADPDHGEAGKVDADERDQAQPVGLWRLLCVGF